MLFKCDFAKNFQILRLNYCDRISCILFGNIVHTLNKEPCANIFLTVPLVDDKMEGERVERLSFMNIHMYEVEAV